MKPVRPGSRGPAVEDIQRRLLVLGFDLGATGVDGVFFGATTEAVRDFQVGAGLAANGEVDDVTWAALVDATFTLGDRMLYLRLPYFHGRDVRVLQEALNTLGFSCGVADGIFGTHTEHAVREFQANSGQSPDGIVGHDTVSALYNLRHVWDGKDGRPPRVDRLSAARAAAVLAAVPIAVEGHDASSREVAGRIVNLASASHPDARVSLGFTDDASILVGIVTEVGSCEGTPLVAVTDSPVEVTGRLLTALAVSRRGGGREIAIDIPDGLDEQGLQRVAVWILDALCAALDTSA